MFSSDMILDATLLPAMLVALLAGLGLGAVRVRARPQALVVITGDEVVAGGGDLDEGRIHDVGGPALVALLEAAVKLRKRAWQGRELPLEPESWELLSSAAPGPDATAEQGELVRAVQEAIDGCYLVGLQASLARLEPSLDGRPWDWDAFAVAQAHYAGLGLAAPVDAS